MVLIIQNRNVCPKMTQNMLMTRKPLMDVMAVDGTLVAKIFLVLPIREKQRRKSTKVLSGKTMIKDVILVFHVNSLKFFKEFQRPQMACLHWFTFNTPRFPSSCPEHKRCTCICSLVFIVDQYMSVRWEGLGFNWFTGQTGGHVALFVLIISSVWIIRHTCYHINNTTKETQQQEKPTENSVNKKVIGSLRMLLIFFLNCLGIFAG